jgi:hypothetical protein
MHQNSYAQTLRLIGQDLQELPLKKFELEVDKAVFIVRGEIVVSESEPKASAPQPKAGFFPGLWKPKTISPEPRAQIQAIERRYTAADLERFAKEGSSHSTSDDKPDFYKPGEFLRVIGSYLDKKRGRLLKLCKDDQEVTLHYQAIDGEVKTERQRMSSFYDLYIHMCKQRHRSTT